MTRYLKKKLNVGGPLSDLLGSSHLKAPFTFLDSNFQEFSSEEFSIFAEAPRHTFIAKEGMALMDGSEVRGDPLSLLSDLHQTWSFKSDLDASLRWPGAIVALSYDLKDSLEPQCRADQKSSTFPDIVAYFYDMWVLESHHTGGIWLLGVDHEGEESFEARFEDFYSRLQRAERSSQETFRVLPRDLKPPKQEYLDTLESLIESMEEGDFYQANMTRKYVLDILEGDVYALYRKLRETSPSPYGAFMEFGNQAIVSASPERFLSIQGSEVRTYPIKGTRPRSSDPQKDAQVQQELLESPKDRAEITMIVDLCRNDLARFCQLGSVEAPEIYSLHTFSGVHHLVGRVQGQVDTWNLKEVISSVFPGGSITGAPKVAAMKRLAQVEPEARGFYTGSIFLLDSGNSLDSNILIRTFLCDHKELSFQVGGGIVVGSSPAAELQETYDKAKTLLETLALTGQDFEAV